MKPAKFFFIVAICGLIIPTSWYLSVLLPVYYVRWFPETELAKLITHVCRANKVLFFLSWGTLTFLLYCGVIYKIGYYLKHSSE